MRTAVFPNEFTHLFAAVHLVTGGKIGTMSVSMRLMITMME